MEYRATSLFLLLIAINAPVPAQSSQPSVSESYLLAALNQDRLAHNLQALAWEPHLAAAALRHGQKMADHAAISHQFTGEAALALRAETEGARFSMISENVAESPDASSLHTLWMNSAPHRANLLDSQANAVGIAVVRLHGQFYAVEDFAHVVDEVSLDDQEERVSRLLAAESTKDRLALNLIHDPESARRTCEMATGFSGSRKPWFVMRYTTSDLQRIPEELTAKLESRRYREASVGACQLVKQGGFSSYTIAVLLYP